MTDAEMAVMFAGSELSDARKRTAITSLRLAQAEIAQTKAEERFKKALEDLAAENCS